MKPMLQTYFTVHGKIQAREQHNTSAAAMQGQVLKMSTTPPVLADQDAALHSYGTRNKGRRATTGGFDRGTLIIAAGVLTATMHAQMATTTPMQINTPQLTTTYQHTVADSWLRQVPGYIAPTISNNSLPGVRQ